MRWAGCQQFGPINTAVLLSVTPFCSAAVLIGPHSWHPGLYSVYTLSFYRAIQQCYTWLHLTTAVLHSSPLHQACAQIDQMTEQRWTHCWVLSLHQYVLQYRLFSVASVYSEFKVFSPQPFLPVPCCWGALIFRGLYSKKNAPNYDSNIVGFLKVWKA